MRCRSAPPTTLSRPAPPVTAGGAWTTSPRSWPSSNRAAPAPITTPLRQYSTTSTTCRNGGTTGWPLTCMNASAAGSPSPTGRWSTRAISVTSTRPWGGPRRRSTTTSRPWTSPAAKPATATRKARGWAASATATGPSGRPRRRSTLPAGPGHRRETGNRGNEGAWLGSLGNIYRTLGQTEKAIDTTSRPWPSPAKPATAATKARGWAISATYTGPSGRPTGRSSTTSRPWPSPAKPATAATKARGWAISATATGPSGRPTGRSSTTSRPWPSPAKPATATGRRLAGQSR